jgi:hypothetical protein
MNMKNMRISMGGSDCLPSGMTSRALSGKPAQDRPPRLSKEVLAGLAQRLVSRAESLAKSEGGGKLSPEGEKTALELGKLLEDHGRDLDGIKVVRDGKQADAYTATLMSRASLLSLKDGGCTGGC